MSKSKFNDDKWIFMVLISPLFALIVVGLVLLPLHLHFDILGFQEQRQKYLKQIEQQGEIAACKGVSSESNPYQGVHGHAAESKAWLDGWMKAKE